MAERPRRRLHEPRHRQTGRAGARAGAAIADYDRAIELMQALRDALGRRLADPMAKRPRQRLHKPRQCQAGRARARAGRRRSPTTTAPSSSCRRCATPLATTGRSLAKRPRRRLHEPRQCQAGRAGTRAGGGDRRLRPCHRAHAGAARPPRRRLSNPTSKRTRRRLHEPRHRQARRAGPWADRFDRRLRPRHRDQAGAARPPRRQLANPMAKRPRRRLHEPRQRQAVRAGVWAGFRSPTTTAP